MGISKRLKVFLYRRGGKLPASVTDDAPDSGLQTSLLTSTQMVFTNDIKAINFC
jgi:hypothetical protein